MGWLILVNLALFGEIPAAVLCQLLVPHLSSWNKERYVSGGTYSDEKAGGMRKGEREKEREERVREGKNEPYSNSLSKEP